MGVGLYKQAWVNQIEFRLKPSLETRQQSTRIRKILEEAKTPKEPHRRWSTTVQGLCRRSFWPGYIMSFVYDIYAPSERAEWNVKNSEAKATVTQVCDECLGGCHRSR